jgi:hypothetical protein
MTTLFDWQTERDSALAQVERNAGEEFKARAMAFALEWMAGKGTVSGEDITDACKAAGIVPHEDRAFGPVYLKLARQGAIVRVGYMARRRGHGAPGPGWRLA